MEREHMYKIRTNHHQGYRNGEWAGNRGIVPYEGRDCYWVVFDDGIEDFWPVDDPNGMYELRSLNA